MPEFLIFSIRSIFIGLLFYGIYFLFLKRKAPFGFLRFYFILALISMAIIPLLPWMGLHFPRLSFFSYIPLRIDSLKEVWLPIVSANAKSQLPNTGASLLVYVYLIFAGILAIRLLWSLISVTLLWLKSDRIRRNGLNIAVTPKSIPVFSFFNWIFIDDKTLRLPNANLILEHENLHIQQKHTLDLLLGELIRILLWFNPFIYFIMKEMKANHEFLADISVTETSEEINTYQKLLIQLSTAVDFNILTHNFNYSLIKRRINMIKKPERNMRRFKLYSLTTLALAGVFFVCSINPETAKGQSVTKVVKVNSGNRAKDSSPIFVVVEKMPRFPGGDKALMNYLANNVHYPEKAKKQGTQGTVYLHFVINKDGSVSDVKVLRGVSPELDAEAVRVVKAMPKWIPGEQKGQKVRVAFNLPIKFSLK